MIFLTLLQQRESLTDMIHKSVVNTVQPTILGAVGGASVVGIIITIVLALIMVVMVKRKRKDEDATGKGIDRIPTYNRNHIVLTK